MEAWLGRGWEVSSSQICNMLLVYDSEADRNEQYKRQRKSQNLQI
jgi:hypothetical protein